MASTSEEKPSNSGLHVLIAGAGIVGLTIAQGCKKNGIPFTIFERDPDRTSKSQGWALTLHWSLNSLRRTIDEDLAKELSNVSLSHAFIDLPTRTHIACVTRPPSTLHQN